MSAQNDRFLTDDQIYALNEKYGWFEFGDAQSDVSRAFAQDAIALYERIRASAPELLEALTMLWQASEGLSDAEISARIKARNLIARVTGTQP